MAHLISHSIKELICKGLVEGIDLDYENISTEKCEKCIIVGKSYRLPFVLNNSTTCPLEGDVMVPLEVNSLVGSRYMLTFLDDHSVYILSQNKGSSDGKI